MKKILVVIDMQNDFIKGSLGTPEAEAIVDKVVDKIMSYPKENVYGTMDTHHENYFDTQEGRNLPLWHCVYNTVGWKLSRYIEPLIDKDRFYTKNSFGSPFLVSELLYLNEKEPIEIEIVGLCTDICVVSNALMLKSFLPEVPITVDAKCCAGVTPETHEAALKTMEMCQIKVVR